MSEDFGTRAASAEVEIRRATVADAEAGAWCHLLCWQEAYAGLLAPERLREKTDPQGIGRRTERWAAAIDAGVVRWLALNPAAGVPVRDRVIGFSSPGPARDEDAPTPLELYAIYTRKAWWGTGLGQRLLDVAIGRQAASLWVLEGNDRACAFYRRNGFAEDGARADEEFFGVPEIRMVRPAQLRNTPTALARLHYIFYVT
ncbi:GCN5-related N-acetyltransferase [Kribbella flavida DSM 17836]|uniref:GCN5-related N-acetyltransferase n=1 Tax=Kribbella flavida (strain DSM 17836 / JCM 10339 / NBRC 14399) TaxID=479435 RepID=D2Q4V2_KRIFD|nr:GNAT family N-acetyltransferase [Kribbella flavida]ADB34207.1 GCN5-related N-acetyltransferase [Kribbella flavida DSM 17836]